MYFRCFFAESMLLSLCDVADDYTVLEIAIHKELADRVLAGAGE